jgi:hypothetical protein
MTENTMNEAKPRMKLKSKQNGPIRATRGSLWSGEGFAETEVDRVTRKMYPVRVTAINTPLIFWQAAIY